MTSLSKDDLKQLLVVAIAALAGGGGVSAYIERNRDDPRPFPWTSIQAHDAHEAMRKDWTGEVEKKVKEAEVRMSTLAAANLTALRECESSQTVHLVEAERWKERIVQAETKMAALLERIRWLEKRQPQR